MVDVGRSGLLKTRGAGMWTPEKFMTRNAENGVPSKLRSTLIFSSFASRVMVKAI